MVVQIRGMKGRWQVVPMDEEARRIVWPIGVVGGPRYPIWKQVNQLGGHVQIALNAEVTLEEAALLRRCCKSTVSEAFYRQRCKHQRVRPKLILIKVRDVLSLTIMGELGSRTRPTKTKPFIHPDDMPLNEESRKLWIEAQERGRLLYRDAKTERHYWSDDPYFVAW